MTLVEEFVYSEDPVVVCDVGGPGGGCTLVTRFVCSFVLPLSLVAGDLNDTELLSSRGPGKLAKKNLH